MYCSVTIVSYTWHTVCTLRDIGAKSEGNKNLKDPHWFLHEVPEVFFLYSYRLFRIAMPAVRRWYCSMSVRTHVCKFERQKGHMCAAVTKRCRCIITSLLDDICMYAHVRMCLRCSVGNVAEGPFREAFPIFKYVIFTAAKMLDNCSTIGAF